MAIRYTRFGWLCILAFAVTLYALFASSIYDHRHENYSRTQFTLKERWRVTLDLAGDIRMMGDVEFRGAPYRLFVIIRSPARVHGSIFVSDIEIIPQGGGGGSVNIDGVHSDQFVNTLSWDDQEPWATRKMVRESVAAVQISGLNLPYVDYRLRCKVRIKTDEETIILGDIDGLFVREPNEWKSNPTLDAWMSI